MIDALRLILIAMLFIIIGACVMNQAQSSVAKSQAADVSSTALGLGLGFTEANPLGLALLPVKALTVIYADCPSLDAVNSITYGVTGWNIALIAGTSGLIGVPIALVLYHANKKPCLTEQQKLRIEWDRGYAAFLAKGVP